MSENCIPDAFLLFVAVDCGPLPVPTNGSSSGDSTVFPNAIQFSCDPGFILSGSASRMCQTNGTWSGFSTECSGKLNERSCSSPSYPESRIPLAVIISLFRSINDQSVKQSIKHSLLINNSIIHVFTHLLISFICLFQSTQVSQQLCTYLSPNPTTVNC